MKRVKLEPVKTILGRPFRIPKLDSNRGPDEEPEIEETTKLTDLLKVLIFGLPRPKLTMKDSIEGARLYEQLQGAKDGVVAIEDEEHKWIKDKVEEYGPGFFGVNAVRIKDALDNFERAHEKKEKKAGAQKETAEETEEE